MEDRIAANDRYADLNSSDMRFLSAVGKGVLGYDFSCVYFTNSAFLLSNCGQTASLKLKQVQHF